MSSGALARSLGPVACVLLLATGPLDLASAWVSRRQLVVWGGASAQLVPPGARPLPAPRQVAGLAGIVAGYGVAASVALSAVSGMSYSQAAWWWWVCWVAIYLMHVLPDMVATKVWVYFRKPSSLDTLVKDHQAAMLYGVAAYPRGRRHGADLLRRVNEALDAAKTPCVLTARAQPGHELARRVFPSRVSSTDLVDYYAAYGYASVEVKQPPALRDDSNAGQPYAGRRMIRFPADNGWDG